MTDLPSPFDLEMLKIYQRAKLEAKYTATAFFGMLSKRGGLATAKYLINSEKISDGYTALHERGRLDLTVEAVVVENTKWHSLFSEVELDICRNRLKKYEYTPKTQA
ncbi:MAG TPA: hypothetical protein VLA00_08795 [Xanthobacteraceae bacterium]|nr:hypothetical protein [Xanthobacteraceae bacterium]